MKKFKLLDAKTIGTPMSTSTMFDEDEKGKNIDMKSIEVWLIVYFILLLVDWV